MAKKKQAQSSKQRRPTKKAPLKLPPEDRKMLAEMKQEAEERIRAEQEVLKQSVALKQRHHQAHERMYRQLCQGAGLDYDALVKQTDRLHHVQRRRAASAFKKLRQASLSRIKQLAAKRKRVARAYVKKFKKDLDAMVGNPILKFSQPAEHDARVTGDSGGLYGGGHSTDLPVTEYSLQMSVDYSDPARTGELNQHTFYPRIRIETGDFSDHMYLTIEQSITLYHPPLTPGRGNFAVDRMEFNLHGIGYAEARVGDHCPFLLDSTVVVMTSVEMDVEVHQRTPVPMTGRVLNGMRLLRGGSADSGAAEIDLRPFAYPVSFMLAGSDGGGGGIYLTIVLRTHAGTFNRHGFAEVNFSMEETDGLHLGCVQLHGEYV